MLFISNPSLAQNIHEAAKAGNLEQLKSLLTADPSLIKSMDKDRNTPLHHAIDAGHLPAASFLIQKGADVNFANYSKETPLHIAAYNGNPEAVKLLLKHGANIAAREMRDRTPLFLACNWGRNLETVKLLITAGSDVNDKNSRGEIVLVSSLYYGTKELIDLLIDSGATIPEDEETLRRALYVSAANGMERPFQLAVESCEKQKIKWWTGIPMQACARGGSISIAKALIAKGVKFKEKNIYGIEPLHIAAEHGRKALVEFLLSIGVEIDSPSRMGKTALHFAQEHKHQDVAALLIQKKASQSPPKFPVFKGEYLGQEKPGDTPQMFAPGIVSSHHYDNEHSPAVFSPDGKEVYWTLKFRGPILCMKNKQGVWTAPETASFNSEYGDGEPFFSPDGSKIYFLSFRPLKPGGATDKENLWYVKRTPQGWSEPESVSPLINAFDLHWLVSVSRKGTIYFSSIRDGGFGSRDIYSSRLVNGEYQEPENLGEVINTSGIDHTPYIAPDESYLIYVSTGKSASPGDMKFYISYRSQDGAWLKPIDIGQSINFPGRGLWPVITPDGKYMFFLSRGDIYWVEASFIQDLRKSTSGR